VRIVDGQREAFIALSVGDLGDLRTHVGLFEIDGTGKTIAAAAEGAAEGDVIPAEALEAGIPRWQTGSAANLMLLAPVDGGYRVEHVFTAGRIQGGT
jgi:hypothetical protein